MSLVRLEFGPANAYWEPACSACMEGARFGLWERTHHLSQRRAKCMIINIALRPTGDGRVLQETISPLSNSRIM